MLARSTAGIPRTVTTDEAARGALQAATDGDGFDLVFDATGNRASMQASFTHVAHGGTLVFVGLLDTDITFSDAEFHKREMTLVAIRNATLVDFEHVMASIRAGAVPVEALITNRTPIDGAAAALPRWAEDKSGLIKAVVEVA